MTGRDAKIFGCPACSTAVSGLEAECPRCHLKFGPEVRFECPFCSDQVPPGLETCPSCHLDFKLLAEKTDSAEPERATEQLLDELIDIESKIIKEGEWRFTCPQCSRLLEGGEGTCPSCGHPIEADGKVHCPICGEPVASNLEACPHCGRPFIPLQASQEPPAAAPPQPVTQDALHPPGPSALAPESPLCPICGGQLDQATGWCVQCGFQTKGKEALLLERDLRMLEQAPVQPAEKPRRCPTCGKEIPPEEPGCPYCSAVTKLESLPERIGAAEPAMTEHDEAIEKLSDLLEVTGNGQQRKTRKLKAAAPAGRSTEPAPPQRGLASSVGRINGTGLVNGRGVVNGRGAVNGRGIVNGKGAVNGRGLVSASGAINGRGAINGTPFTNGTGMSNGIKPRRGAFGRSNVLGLMVTKWQFLAVLVAVAIVIPTFIYMSFSGQGDKFSVDGDFGEWADAQGFGVRVLSAASGTDIESWSVGASGSRLFLYVRSQDPMMASPEVESLFLFADSDNSSSTGYVVGDLGADYLMEIDGWNGSVQSTAVMLFSSDDDRYNWSSWQGIGSMAFSGTQYEIEASAWLFEAISPGASMMLIYKDQQDRVASSNPVPISSGGLLVVEQGPAPGAADSIVDSSASVQMLRLTFSSEGASGSVSAVSPIFGGCSQAGAVEPFSLSPGDEVMVDVSVDTSLAAAGQLVTAAVDGGSISSTFDRVEVRGVGARAYVATAPASIAIDGAFADWAGLLVPDSDGSQLSSPGLDIADVGSTNSSDSAYFYVGVQGQIFAGCVVPKALAWPSGGGGGVIEMPRRTAEDITRIYIDTDRSSSTGLMIADDGVPIGADWMVQISGIYGEIVSRSLFVRSSGQWADTSSALPLGNDDSRLEVGVDLASLGSNGSFDYIVETTDWQGRADLADAVPGGTRAFSMPPGIDSWAVDGSTTSAAATSMSYQRKVFYDGTNFWSFYQDGSNTVYRYSTDGGQTWSSKSTAFTTSGMSEVSVWYDSGNNIVYAVGDISTASVNVYLRRGTVDPGAHSITWGTQATLAVSTLNLGGKNTYISKDASGYLWVVSSNYSSTSPLRYQLSTFKSVSTDSLVSWTFAGHLLTGQGVSSSNVVGSVVPAGTGSDMWGVYGWNGNVATRKYTGSWSGQNLILTASGTVLGNTFNSPPSVVVDSRKVAHVVYGDCNEVGASSAPRIWYTHNDTGATTFTTPLALDSTIPSDVADLHPTISLETSSGDLFAFWLRTDTSLVGKTVMGKRNTSGTWQSLTIGGDTSYAKQHLTSVYSASGQSNICWQWTQNTSVPIYVLFDKIPEFGDIAIPLVFMIAVFALYGRRARGMRLSSD